ncbi:MAG TPA: AAA family ATPase, partial [Acidimicrobiia bacterium]|nr:AAA family ATPase [Acidimicrobiia bacterium]
MEGRAAEVEALRALWRDGGSVAVVRGPAGIGKSRLVREVAAWIAAQGGVVLVGRATPTGKGTSLRPLREALLGLARRGFQPDDELAPFLPALGALVPDWAEGSVHPESALVVGEATLRLLRWLGGEQTATLIVEDLQWADPETAEAFEYLADNVHSLPALVIATVREGEAGVGADVAASLVGRRTAEEIQLGPLTGQQVVDMAKACTAGGEIPAEVLQHLVARSEGIPLLVEELVATAAAAGWETVAATVPGSVIASVERRLAERADASRLLLVAFALLGPSSDWRLAAAAVSMSEDDAAAALRRAVADQLLAVEGRSFRFRHALTRDAVLASAPPAELTLLAERLLMLIEHPDDVRGGDDRMVVADLAIRASQLDRGARLLLQEARAALERGALATADDLAERAASLGVPEFLDDVQLVRLEAAVLSGRTEQATTVGVELVDRTTDERDRAHVLLLLGAADVAAGRWSEAVARAEAVLRLHPGNEHAARAHSLAALAAMGREDHDVASVHARLALDEARTAELASVQCEALEVLGRIERGRDVDEAERLFREAFDTASSAGLALWRVRALQELGTIDLFGSLGLERLRQARDEASMLGALATVAVVDLQLAAVHDERGELDEAMAAAIRCGDVSERLRLSTAAMASCVKAMVHARRGDRGAMQAAIAQARATGQDVDYVTAGIAGNALSIFHIGAGDLEAAAAELDRAMAIIRERPSGVLPVPGLWALVHTLLGDGAAERAEAAALPFDTPVSRHMLVAAEAVAVGSAGDAARAEARFAEADHLLSPADGGFRRPLVHLLVSPAALRDGWGDPTGWLREAMARFERMGAHHLAAQCRARLRDAGAAVPRRRA